MILSITLNPSVDRTIFIDGLQPHDANRVVRCEMDAGGKGVNAARIIAEFDVPVLATGFLGGRTGRFVEGVLDDEGVPHRFISVASETRLNISVEDGTGKPPTTFNEKGSPVSADERKQLDLLIDKQFASCKFVAAGGSLPPNIESDVYAEMAQRAAKQGVRIAIDADGDALREAIKAKPFFVKPNADEAERLLGDSVNGFAAATKAARSIRKMGVEIVIVSLGKHGAVLSSEGADLIIEAPEVDAASTIGAGDSMVGGFLAGLYLGVSLEEAFRYGAAAGAATAATGGSEIGRKDMIDSLLPQVKVRKA